MKKYLVTILFTGILFISPVFAQTTISTTTIYTNGTTTETDVIQTDSTKDAYEDYLFDIIIIVATAGLTIKILT